MKALLSCLYCPHPFHCTSSPLCVVGMQVLMMLLQTADTAFAYFRMRANRHGEIWSGVTEREPERHQNVYAFSTMS